MPWVSLAARPAGTLNAPIPPCLRGRRLLPCNCIFHKIQGNLGSCVRGPSYLVCGGPCILYLVALCLRLCCLRALPALGRGVLARGPTRPPMLTALACDAGGGGWWPAAAPPRRPCPPPPVRLALALDTGAQGVLADGVGVALLDTRYKCWGGGAGRTPRALVRARAGAAEGQQLVTARAPPRGQVRAVREARRTAPWAAGARRAPRA